MRRICAVFLAGWLGACSATEAAESDAAVAETRAVGTTADGGRLAPTGQLVRPEGDVLDAFDRPLDVAASDDGARLFVKDSGALVVVDVAAWRVLGRVKFAGDGASQHGLVVAAGGRLVYATGAKRTLWVFA